jgi:rubrerythrin
MPVAGLTALEALGIAVRREMDAAASYQQLADRCDSPLARDRFMLLAQEARHHEALLRARYAREADGAELAIPPAPVAPAPEGPLCTEGLGGALHFALDAERRTREFYLEAAHASGDPAGQEMFAYLADVHAHLVMILESQSAMVLRYPRAFDDVTPGGRHTGAAKGAREPSGMIRLVRP